MNRTLLYRSAIVFALATSLVSAQARSAKSQNQTSARVQKTSPLEARSNTNATRTSDWTMREVRHELVMLPYLSVFDHLAYKLDGDKLTLLGYVSNPSLKSDAESAVKKVEGVASIDNRIQVLPNSPSDDRLRLALYREIFSEGGLFRYGIQSVPPVHIIVSSGRVILEGVVSTEADKNIAFIKANGVPGVFSVTNNLQVVSEKSQK